MRSLLALCLVVSTTAFKFEVPNLFGSVQSAGVRGKLMCNGEPAQQVKVKLYDVDTFPDIDDLMAEGFTESDGTFELKGHEKETTAIDPQLNVYHKCGHSGRCFKKMKMTIPANYISPGETPEKIFDIGEINLAARFSGDDTDCIN